MLVVVVIARVVDCDGTGIVEWSSVDEVAVAADVEEAAIEGVTAPAYGGGAGEVGVVVMALTSVTGARERNWGILSHNRRIRRGKGWGIPSNTLRVLEISYIDTSPFSNSTHESGLPSARTIPRYHSNGSSSKYSAAILTLRSPVML